MISGINPTSQQLLNSINYTQANLTNAANQISSGLRITQASDDPQMITDLLTTRSDLAQATQVANNMGTVKNEVDTADTSLQEAVQLMDQAGALATEGASSNVSADARATLAQQISGIQQQMVTISRTEVQGTYIFSGDQTSTPPYELNSDPTSLTGVTQLTTAPATRLLQDTSGLTFAVSLTAQQIFDARDSSGNITTNNVFAALQGLQTALLANNTTAIQTAATTVNTADTYLNEQASFYGSVEDQISTALDLAQKFETQDQTSLSNEQDANVASDALEMTQDTTQIDAALASASKQNTTNLFSYMQG
jgi:flagellar hook-associated protein 3 FlgL